MDLGDQVNLVAAINKGPCFMRNMSDHKEREAKRSRHIISREQWDFFQAPLYKNKQGEKKHIASQTQNNTFFFIFLFPF